MLIPPSLPPSLPFSLSLSLPSSIMTRYPSLRFISWRTLSLNSSISLSFLISLLSSLSLLFSPVTRSVPIHPHEWSRDTHPVNIHACAVTPQLTFTLPPSPPCPHWGVSEYGPWFHPVNGSGHHLGYCHGLVFDHMTAVCDAPQTKWKRIRKGKTTLLCGSGRKREMDRSTLILSLFLSHFICFLLPLSLSPSLFSLRVCV